MTSKLRRTRKCSWLLKNPISNLKKSSTGCLWNLMRQLRQLIKAKANAYSSYHGHKITLRKLRINLITAPLTIRSRLGSAQGSTRESCTQWPRLWPLRSNLWTKGLNKGLCTKLGLLMIHGMKMRIKSVIIATVRTRVTLMISSSLGGLKVPINMIYLRFYREHHTLNKKQRILL